MGITLEKIKFISNIYLKSIFGNHAIFQRMVSTTVTDMISKQYQAWVLQRSAEHSE